MIDPTPTYTPLPPSKDPTGHLMKNTPATQHTMLLSQYCHNKIYAHEPTTLPCPERQPKPPTRTATNHYQPPTPNTYSLRRPLPTR